MKDNDIVLYFQRVMVPYREEVFKRVNKLANIVVCIGKKGPPLGFHPEGRLDFPFYKVGSWYPIPKKESLVVQNVVPPLLKFRPRIVVIEFSTLIISNWVILLLRRFLKYKLILWTQGYNRKIGFLPKKHFVDRLRVWWIDRADAVIFYSQSAMTTIAPYINNPQKLFVAQNTLDTDNLIQRRECLEQLGKNNVKISLGFTEEYNLIFLGRLIKDKEPDRLIEVFRIIAKKLDSVALHIVGDGPLAGKLKEETKNLNITFWGAISCDNKLSELFFASDIMVIPGYLGLAVVYAFCFGVPVVSQKKGDNGPFHSPEIEYIINGKTGYLADYDNNDKMAEVIVNYLTSQELRCSMRREMEKIVADKCSIDKMIEGFNEAFDYVSKR